MIERGAGLGLGLPARPFSIISEAEIVTDIVTQFPRQVREIENLFIPLSDGYRLAAIVAAASRLTGADQWLAIGRNFLGIPQGVSLAAVVAAPPVESLARAGYDVVAPNSAAEHRRSALPRHGWRFRKVQG